jgi:Putative metallopeptidase
MRHSIKMLKRSVVTALAAGLLPAFQAAPTLAQAPILQPNPQIQVEYLQPKYNSAVTDKNQYNEFTTIYAWLRVRRPLEEIQKFLAPLRLPRPIKIEVDTCGAERRTYVSGGPVTICYELIAKIEKTAAAITGDDRLKQIVIVGTFTQAVLHELAYGVFDVLQVPVWGREDDAADRLAAFVLLQFSDDVAHTAMVGSAEFFLLSRKTWTGSAFAGAGSPEAQRFYNFLCVAYGGDPLDFGGWTEAPEGKDPLLPKFRTDHNGCAYEYEQVRNAFNLRIMPYVDPDLLLQVKAGQWFLPGELSK